jgi:2-polyprenyl-3-methyl-5-hydroxy-6-metoxy-1,4-benzoquinol methylase
MPFSWSGRCGITDAGCGEGWLARALATRGSAVIGVDASRA